MGRFDKLPGIDEKNTTRRNIVVGGVYALAGCVALGAIAPESEDDGNGNGDTGGTDGSESTEDTDTDNETQPDGETEEEEELPEAGELGAVSENTAWLQDSTSLSGNGQSVTDSFDASRFTTLVYEHNGSSNFIVELINDETGETEDILVNEIGAVSGAVGIGLSDASYILDVDADGDWSIQLGEPFAPEEEWGVPPATIAGDAPDVYGEVEIDGRVTVSGEHEGEGNFIVTAWDEMNAGPFPNEIIFNEIGQFEGETSVQLSGLFYIAVQADGAYRIRIK